MGDNKFERQFSMDEDDYNLIAEAAQNGEYIDFEIPADAPMGRKYSELAKGTPQNTEPDDEFVPVDLSQEFKREE